MIITENLILDKDDFLASEIQSSFLYDDIKTIRFEAEKITGDADEITRMKDDIQYFFDHIESIEKLILSYTKKYYR
jgi:hypothetical protein